MNFNNLFSNKKFLVVLFSFLLILGGLAFYSLYAGLFLIFSLLVFGILSLFWKEKELRIAALSALVLLSLINVGLNGMKFGIDFSGGTRIPVILEHSVDEETMNELVDIIKKRSSVLGLSEVRVRAVGDMEIDVEIPSSNEEQIAFIEDVLSHQGVYQGITDGKVAIQGDDILPGTIKAVPSPYLGSSADWGVSFSVTTEGAKHFAETVKGKANYPLYMYLDRPSDAIIIISREDFTAKSPSTSSIDDLIDAAEDALVLEDKTINLYFIDELEDIPSAKTNKTLAIVSEDYSQDLKQSLESLGYTVREYPAEEIQPSFINVTYGFPPLEKWEAVGLLSAPYLNEGITDGSIHTNYQISGRAEGTGTEKYNNIEENEKRIISVLKGGALPVKISIESRTILPASLGSEFLRLSLIGIGSALVVISILIGLRYRKIKIILPIVIISISELIILLSILGSFTIDLAAMAGIIAAIGVGVDAQIVITDELLKKDIKSHEVKMDNAFQIIKTNVIVAIVAMVPLLFSGLVEVIGFAISTILGSLLGYLLSRPAYAAIVENILEE
ncbi:hypothetical protein JXB01_01800 [Candidatus Micrarchaeota archaeon]|nr:hypothetical protein [Candidatus Micrarchaeota archaeon]